MSRLETAIHLTTSINERFSLNNLQLLQINRSLMLSAGTTISEKPNDWMICAGPIGIAGFGVVLAGIVYILRSDKRKKPKEKFTLGPGVDVTQEVVANPENFSKN